MSARVAPGLVQPEQPAEQLTREWAAASRRFDPAAVEVLAAARLFRSSDEAAAVRALGDAITAGFPIEPAALAAAHPAAVLVPVVARAEGATLLMTERSSGLRQHSGQIAFPGGRIDPGDAGPLAAALREASEEIGLDASTVRPVGYLGRYLSGSGYGITPVVAMIEPDPVLTINPLEVGAVFEVPLAFLMDPANHVQHEREWRGAARRYYAIPFGERYIWGVTAGIIRMLWQRLYGA